MIYWTAIKTIGWPLLQKYWLPLVLGLAFIWYTAKIYEAGEHAQESVTAKVQLQLDQFVSQATIIGKAAQAESERIKNEDNARKQKADEIYNTSMANLAADNERLRIKERARGNYLPAAAPGSAHPDRACTQRADTDRAIGQFVAEVQGIAEQGQSERVGLNNAKEWAQSPH